MRYVHAHAGDYLTCPAGHGVAIFTRDVVQGDLYRLGDLDFIYYDTPETGAPLPTCPACAEVVFWADGVAVARDVKS